jgi:carbonic anhydrase
MDDRLIEGYRRFRAEIWPSERARYERLSEKGQRPETMVIACSDSRVDPATVFGAVPGQLFTLRSVAGLVPPYGPDMGYHGTSAALEYGVRILKVSQVVVLGHAQCGGVQAMLEGTPIQTDFVDQWMNIAKPALSCVRDAPHGENIVTRCETEVVRLSLANLLTFPWIAEAVKAGELRVRGFHFGIQSGVLAKLEGDQLVPVT